MRVPSKVLIATDFSGPARRAVELGGKLAARLDAEVVLLHVYAIPVGIVPDTFVAITPSQLESVVRSGEHLLDDVAAVVRQLGVTRVSTRLVEGVPWREIIGLAEAEAFDLIVVGTHGHGGLAHLLVGSVAEKVVRTAGRPVLVAGGKD